MLQLPHTVKQIILAGYCGLGFGWGAAFGQENTSSISYGMQGKERDSGHPVNKMTEKTDFADTRLLLDSLYSMRANMFAAEYTFLTRHDVDSTVDHMMDFLKNGMNDAHSPVACPVEDMTAQMGKIYHRPFIGAITGQPEAARGFDVEYEIMHAYQAGGAWISAPAGYNYYAYNVKDLDALMQTAQEFGERENASVGIIIPTDQGVQAYAVHHEKWQEGKPKFVSVLLLGDLLALLDFQEVEAIQYHELGHFKFDWMANGRVRNSYMNCILDQLGYSRTEKRKLRPLSEEIFADIYSAREMVKKYGENAEGIAQSALTKITATAVFGFLPKVMMSGLEVNGNSHENTESYFRMALMELLMAQQRETVDDPQHPTLPARLDILDRAHAYYMQTPHCPCD